MKSDNTERSFEKEINKVAESADGWYENEYKASSERLTHRKSKPNRA